MSLKIDVRYRDDIFFEAAGPVRFILSYELTSILD